MKILNQFFFSCTLLFFCNFLLSCTKPELMRDASVPVLTEPVFCEPLTDIDGNIYKTVKIGNRIWTAENLKTTRYNDSLPILLITDDTEWRNAKKGAYCHYNHNFNNTEKFGALYNWHALQSGKLAPDGWHVPADSDWNYLERYLKDFGFNADGTRTGSRIGKAIASTMNWAQYQTGGAIGNISSNNNSTGFSALPGGHRYLNGEFFDLRKMGFYWSSTENGHIYAWDRHLSYDSNQLYRESRNKQWGLSVRLVKNAN